MSVPSRNWSAATVPSSGRFAARLLPHHADAEDAFQAVFLALVRGVFHTCRPGLARMAARGCRARGGQGTAKRGPAAAARNIASRSRNATIPSLTNPGPRLMDAVHEEIRGLPESERTAFILCDLEGVRPAGRGRAAGLAARHALRAALQGPATPARPAHPGAASPRRSWRSADWPARPVRCRLPCWNRSIPSRPRGAAGIPSTVANLARGLVEGTTMRTKMLAATFLVAGALSMSGGGTRALAGRCPERRRQQCGFGPRGPASGQGPRDAGRPGGGAQTIRPGRERRRVSRARAARAVLFGGQGRGMGGMMGMASGPSGWEYKFVDVVNDYKTFERTLTQQGRDGWEYVWIGTGFSGQGRTELVLVFKKPRGWQPPDHEWRGNGRLWRRWGRRFRRHDDARLRRGQLPGGLSASGTDMLLPDAAALGVVSTAGDIEARTQRLRKANATDLAKAIERRCPRPKRSRSCPRRTRT